MRTKDIKRLEKCHEYYSKIAELLNKVEDSLYKDGSGDDMMPNGQSVSYQVAQMRSAALENRDFIYYKIRVYSQPSKDELYPQSY